jgi:hypothetical protein
MPNPKATSKVECLNPTTGGRMNIDKEIYELFSKAIRKTLQGGKALTYTGIVEGVKKYLKTNPNNFTGAVAWYAITVKKDMEARGELEVFEEKRKKLNKLKPLKK